MDIIAKLFFSLVAITMMFGAVGILGIVWGMLK